MIKNFLFSVSTGYSGCEKKEEIEIEFEETDTEADIDNRVDEYFNDWLGNNIDAGYSEVV